MLLLELKKRNESKNVIGIKTHNNSNDSNRHLFSSDTLIKKKNIGLNKKKADIDDSSCFDENDKNNDTHDKTEILPILPAI